DNIEKYWRRYELTQPVLGSMETYAADENDHFVVAITDNKFRKKMVEMATLKKWKFINYIHPSNIVSNNLKIGIGNIICPKCIIGPKSVIGDFNILNCSATISHDCIVGNFNLISSFCGLAGHVKIQDNNFFSLHSAVIPKINIGSNNIVAPAIIIDRDVENDSTIFYRYKEKVLAIPKAI
ncbi:MAG TPA: acetyltransferase, partial [Segetibacter sp.]